MAKTNVATTPQATKTPSKRAAGEGSKPSKKPRTGLAAAPAVKGSKPTPPLAASAKEGPAAGDGALDGKQMGEVAFARVRAEVEALPVEELRRINTYVPSSVAIAVGVWPKLMTLREPMQALPGGADALDKLQDYALATLYAHALTLPFGEGDTRLRALLAEAAPLRERLLSSAELLVRFGLFDATHVAAIRNGTGYLDTAQDCTALAALFRGSWAEVGSKTPVTIEEVNRAAELGPLLVMAFGRRQQGTDGAGDPSEAYDRLVRAYTLFFNAYDDCRRAVTFLRWREGDADSFAPTLKQTSRRRSAQADDGGDDETPEPGGETPGGSNGGTGGNGGNGGNGTPGGGTAGNGTAGNGAPGNGTAGGSTSGGAKPGVMTVGGA